MTRQLAITCERMTDESLDGFLRRSLQKNYVTKLDWFEELYSPLTGGPLSFLARGRAIHQIENALGCDNGALLSSTPLPPNASKFIQLGNGRFSPADFRRNKLAICPTCIVERNFHHIANLVAHVRCCPVHGYILIEGCRNCGHPISKNLDLTRCSKCETPVTEAWSTSDSEKSLRLSQSIASIIKDGVKNTPLKWLKAASETELLILAQKIGYYAAEDTDLAYDPSGRVDRIAIGVSVLSNGRRGVRALLKGIQPRTGRHLSHLRHRNLALFGQDILIERSRGNAADAVATVYERYVVEKRIEGVPSANQVIA
mgnify:CR=1 FL=1